ncbi:MAG TPA: histidine phosphatase family protein [Persephonella sp.]|uniref:2,3-bisphosphoglycerate-dependent phosphoglycerate mutase (Phosphoglyceromutase) (Pgam) (Bpg-dependent pgam) (Dpgm) n=1 Tax=Persephonella marina (strain DSM 14350 / EX-H1) TaxID=123214 RepID=C0QQJ5_PERMH|nr:MULTISPECIES: histidine phosphatase family protein [Persephonella]ACO03181.1 2,3-bisphosphoglycerate-dependent phosphoglycerate mutase (phosphoglyceromutase) (pgam) (bpg-dependent pgam) (dpgm) [Persephonella marina EX-H1]HCB69458.1 histidine phosphatase family protein [Persephonella sp.]
MKRLILCRHGESEYNAKRIIQGHIDTDLTPAGVVQARLAGEELKKFNIQRVFSSDLKRAFRTAQIIADVLDMDITKDKRIREMSFGEWEGRTYDHIFETDYQTFQNWLKNPVACPLPYQEDIENFRSRLESFIKDILKLPEDNILIVAHGGSIQGIICIMTGLGLENLWALKHTNTGISVLETDGRKTEIKLLNYSKHLETEKRTETVIL